MKVLLIGNGYSAIEQKYGNIIDSEFDMILRMNRFKTEGFEEYVGSKTDIWVITDIAFKWVLEEDKKVEGSKHWKDYKNIYVYIPSFKYYDEYFRINNEIQSNGLDGKVIILPRELSDIAQKNSNLSEEYWPSVGMNFLYCLILNEDVDEIYIHGFDGKSKKYEYLHYYDVGDPKWKTEAYYSRMTKKAKETPWSKVHDDETEYKHIEKLIEEGKLKKLSEV